MIKRSPQDEKRVTKIKVLQRGGGGGGSLQKVLWQEDVSPVLCAWNPTEAVFVLFCSKKKKDEKFASVQFPTHHLDVVSPAKTSGPAETV